MAKKSTAQGIGYINNATEFRSLVVTVADIIRKEFERNSDNAVAINNIKNKIDNLVGRGRQNFTKTDVYQVSFLMFHPIVKAVQERNNRTFKDTQVNTLVAKLMTEGEYGNPSVVRRQTTSAKLNELKERLFTGVRNFYDHTLDMLSGAQRSGLIDVSGRMLVRGTRSTRTARVSNRSFRATTPRSTTPRTTTPAAPAPSQVTQTTRQVSPYQVANLSSLPQLMTGVRESIKRFGETNDKKLKLQLMAGAWRYQALADIGTMDRGFLTIVDLYNVTYHVFVRIGDVFNPANQGEKFLEANKYLRYVLFLLTGGKIRDAKRIAMTSEFTNETQQTLYQQIFAIGIGRTNSDVFQNFVNFIGSDARILAAISRVFSGFSIQRSDFVVYLKGEASAPTATVTEINVPGYTSEATPPAPAPPPPLDTLIRDMKITDEFDFGVEWEHFGLGLPKIKRAMEKIGQPLYPEYVPYHDFDSYDRAIKPGMFPNNKVNKGWWVLQIDGSVSRDRREPDSEFRNTKQEAIIDQRGRRYDTYEGEFVSPVLGGKRGLAIIKLVGNTLVNSGMRHNRTMGMHTHVTKRGFTRSNIKNLMYNYVAMEPLIEAMMEPNRRSTSPSQYNRSHFIQLGLSLSSTESQVQSVLKQKILDISENQFYIDFGQRKQQAVNLKPFYGGNTIEFRQQGANFEADSVTMWIAFLFYFCEFSKKKRFTGFQWNNLIAIMPVGLASFWYNRIQDLTGKSPYELSFRK